MQDGRFGDDLWEWIMAAGQPYQIAPCAPSQIKRMEAGLFSYLSDMDLSNNPFELGMERFVDLEQTADFMGKEALKRIQAEGITQKFVGIEMGSTPFPQNEHHWPVAVNGEVVGKLTSCVFSPTLQKNIGYVLVPIALTKPGTPLTVIAPWGDILGRVQKLPFIKNRAK